MKVLIISSFDPDSQNRGGPTGLLHEVMEGLRLNGVDVEFKKIEVSSRMGEAFLKYFCFVSIRTIFKLWLCRDKYDAFILYPSWLYFYAFIFGKRAAVLCPDFTSGTLWKVGNTSARAGHCHIAIARWIQAGIALTAELLVGRLFKLKSIVVGKTDKVQLSKIAGENNVVNLRHPIYSEQLISLSKIEKNTNANVEYNRLLVNIYGDFSYMEKSHFWADIFKYILDAGLAEELEFHIYSKKNIYIHNDAVQFGLKCSLFERFNTFADLYHFRAISLLPITTGGGTKTRTLMSLANGLPVVTVPHGVSGLEDIVSAIYIFHAPVEVVGIFKQLIADRRKVGPDAALAEFVRQERSSAICINLLLKDLAWGERV
jgi:hypothetical protein